MENLKFADGLGFKIKRFYTEIEKMASDPEVEAVICAIPPRFMVPVAAEIIGAGKTALLECPPSDKLEGIDQLSELAKRQKVKVMPGLYYRFVPCFRKVKDLIEAGEIGSPVSVGFKEFVPADSLARQWSPDSWSWNISNGGPIPMMTIFCMDLARWILKSEPISFSASIRWLELPKYGTLGYQVTNVIRFKNNVVWSNEFTSDDSPQAGPPLKMEILDHEGNAVIVDGPEKVILRTEGERKEWSLQLSRTERCSHKTEDKYFLRSVVLKKEEPVVNLTDAKKALMMSLAILKSSQSENPVSFKS
ncbi:MAG: Gfo/Idh/MocA family oxidoreductase [Candidatus Hadarchaeum sp.]